MVIHFYKIKCDKIIANKQPYLGQPYLTLNNVTLKNPENVVDMNISLQLSRAQIASVTNCNYAYIGQLGRYYYLEHPIILNNNMVQFPLHEDVLFSNLETIRNQNAVIERQEKKYNTMLPDNEEKLNANTIVQTFKFPNSFNNQNMQYVVAIAGGAYNG